MRPDAVYRLYLRMKFGASELAQAPGPHIANGTLQSRAERDAATRMASGFTFPCIAAKRRTGTTWPQCPPSWPTRIARHGFSMPARKFTAMSFRRCFSTDITSSTASISASLIRRVAVPIRYIPGDLTHTPFPDGYFDAIACLSVIEHGVPLQNYFREMYRLLKPNGF